MIRTLTAYLAHRLPAATIEHERFHAEPAVFINGERVAGTIAGETRYIVRLDLPNRAEGIAFGALRHAYPSVQPFFGDYVHVVISIPDDPSHVAGNRGRGWYAWSKRQWAELDEEVYAEIAERLESKFAVADARNIATAADARKHPANVRAVEQMAKQAAVLANTPTAEVDRFLAERLGYSYERQAGWGQSTRTKRRKEARQIMTGQATTL